MNTLKVDIKTPLKLIWDVIEKHQEDAGTVDWLWGLATVLTQCAQQAKLPEEALQEIMEAVWKIEKEEGEHDL